MYVIYMPLSVNTTHLEISRYLHTRSVAFAILVSAGVWVDVSGLHHVAAVGTKGAPDKSGVKVLHLLISRVCHCESKPTVQYDLVSAGLLSPYVRLRNPETARAALCSVCIDVLSYRGRTRTQPRDWPHHRGSASKMCCNCKISSSFVCRRTCIGSSAGMQMSTSAHVRCLMVM
jgi:hypothetical protein